MTRPLFIFGAGGFAREVLQVALDTSAESPQAPPWHPVAFIVDAGYTRDDSLHGLPVLATDEAFRRFPQAWVVVAIGNAAARWRIVQGLAERVSAHWATLVHPRAWIGRHVEFGPGSVVCAGSQITTDISIGAHVHVNIGCTIGHDSRLGDFVTLNPGVNLSGNVVLGTGVEVGTGCAIIPHADIGEWSVVGAGSVVTRSLDPNVTAVGAPARAIKSRPAGWHAMRPV